MKAVERIFQAIEQGDPVAAHELLPPVYHELRKFAAQKMAKHMPGNTLQPTALVYEAWLRLAGGHGGKQFANRAHFFAAAAEAMRRRLIVPAANWPAAVVAAIKRWTFRKSKSLPQPRMKNF